MEEKEFRRVLDKYLMTVEMESDEYERMDDLQKYVIQCLKRAFKRINKNQ